MPTTIPHIRLVASGTLGSDTADEIWSCGLKLIYLVDRNNSSGPAAPTHAILQTLATGAAAAWAGYIRSATPAAAEGCTFSDLAKVTAVKASAVLATGKDDPLVTPVIVDITADNQGMGKSGPTATTPIYSVPYTNSLVVTLLGTQFVRGAAAYGRFYPPVPNLYYSTADGIETKMVDGLVDPTVAAAHANAAAQFLITAINQVIPFPAAAQVSNVSTSVAAAGARYQTVTTVRVDTRPDTVRRRSNKLSGRSPQTATVGF